MDSASPPMEPEPEPEARPRLEAMKQRRAQQKAEALKQRRAAADNAARQKRGAARPAAMRSGGSGDPPCSASAAPAATDAATAAMDSELGRALAACGTSNNWSTLEAVATKVSRRAGRKVTPRELDALMRGAGDATLLAHGIWRTSFGKKFMPIVTVNTAFARSAAAAADGEPWACTCGATPAAASGGGGGGDAAAQKRQSDSERFFGSQDYNGGRHACTASVHKGQCLLWRPPTSGHLHSWRRGFADDGRQ